MAAAIPKTLNELLQQLAPGEHPYNLRYAVDRFEQEYVQNILTLTHWNLPLTADFLGISQEALTALLRKYELL